MYALETHLILVLLSLIVVFVHVRHKINADKEYKCRHQSDENKQRFCRYDRKHFTLLRAYSLVCISFIPYVNVLNIIFLCGVPLIVYLDKPIVDQPNNDFKE